MTKPTGPICNLDCKYCFYLEKERLYDNVGDWRMSEEVLESYIRQYIERQDAPEVQFAWQGGEPTLLGVEYFQNVVRLQKRYAGGKRIANAIQTNGTLLDEKWGEFLRENGFLVGLSLDGPADLHDRYRVDKGQKPTFERVMRGLEVLQRAGVEFNTLTVVSRANSAQPLRVYDFLKDAGSRFLQFIPLVERKLTDKSGASPLAQLDFAAPGEEGAAAVTEWSVLPHGYGQFLVEIFDRWVREDVDKISVQLFDSALSTWAGLGPSICVFARTCGDALAMEHNGDLYSCDHYVYPEYRLGNVMEQPLDGMVSSVAQRAFGAAKLESLPRMCRECDVRFACNGECPKHRFTRTPDGEWGLNYLCAAYKRFFTHIDPYMQRMASLLQRGRSPAEIMSALRIEEQTVPRGARGSGRNQECECGSGRKAKRCCGALRGGA